MIAVEYALIEDSLQAIDQQLEKAMMELNWNSQGTPTAAVQSRQMTVAG